MVFSSLRITVTTREAGNLDPSFRIYIQRKDDLWKLCNHVLLYSVVKRAELELVKEYLDKAVGHNHTAAEEDLIILDKLRELKRLA